MTAKQIIRNQFLVLFERQPSKMEEEWIVDTSKLIEAAIAERMPTITDEEIKAHFTTTHKSWKEEPYHKINYDRVTGAKWMRDWFRSRMEEKR
jgi:hypothetical protein